MLLVRSSQICGYSFGRTSPLKPGDALKAVVSLVVLFDFRLTQVREPPPHKASDIPAYDCNDDDVACCREEGPREHVEDERVQNFRYVSHAYEEVSVGSLRSTKTGGGELMRNSLVVKKSAAA